LGYIIYDEGLTIDQNPEFIEHPEKAPEDIRELFVRFTSGETFTIAKGPIARNLDAERYKEIAKIAGLTSGDAVFFVAGKPDAAASFAGLARTRIAQDMDLITDDSFRFCWIVDFPMYERDERTGKIEFSHNPFSMPQGGLEALETMDPLAIKAWQYDIVCNGVELSSGAIRNHNLGVMYKAFEIAGYGADELEARFGGMLKSLRFGAPPCGGSAPGIDRIVMLLANEHNIREVTLFPMTQQAQDLMMEAPAPVTDDRLAELHIRVVQPPPKG
ncbi:MAG: hypothetical protein GEU92_12010, partial [Alphaproteobacteria bacterium]|nr:hypothetical protein [Alphaproteobacteria bacterium]